MGNQADIDQAVADGAKWGGTIGAAGAAAIGLAIGAAVPPPFSAVAAPLGAALGALIGFLVGLSKKHVYTAQEIAANNARAAVVRQQQAQAVAAAAGTAKGIGTAAQEMLRIASVEGATATLGGFFGGMSREQALDQWMHNSEQGQVLLLAEQTHPEWAPMIDNLMATVKQIATAPPLPKGTDFTKTANYASMTKMVDFMNALSQMPGDLDQDPFAYLRPPMSQYMGPALDAVGVNIADPAVVAIMRGNYEAMRSTPRVKMAIPIARASLNAKSGGRIALDKRAFAPSIAPYGVGSFKLFPSTAPYPDQAADDDHGTPLAAPWPHGLDADNFAKPPLASSNLVKVGVPVAAVAGLLLFL